MMRRGMLFGLLVASPLVLAADGSWTSHSFGGVMTHGQQVLRSQPIRPASAPPAAAIAKQLTWKITADGPMPMGFKMKICSVNRCLPLAGLQGEIALPLSFPLDGPLRFEYSSTVRGVLSPPLTILSNQVTLGFTAR